MAYQVYTTDAIVCGSWERGEHDRSLLLFTRDVGMVIARAAGARGVRSKLRYALQDFSQVRVSLVRGKQSWRITGVEPNGNLYFVAKSRDGRAAMLRGVRLLRRLIHGEEIHAELFSVANDGLSYLITLESKDENAETLFALRVLYQLGYIASDDAYRFAVDARTLEEAVTQLGEHAEAMSRQVEGALLVSQL